MARPGPPPEAELIARKRLQPPRMPVTEASRLAGISDTRWSQLENGYRMNRGQPEAEHAPAATLARMAQVVGATAADLEQAGRPDAAAELEALPPPAPRYDDEGHRVATARELGAVVDRLDWRLARMEREMQEMRESRHPNGDDAPPRSA